MSARKKCTRCRQTKGVGEFSKDRSKSDGLRPDCKTCRREYDDKYLEKNQARITRYREENRDQLRERNREAAQRYRERNGARRREQRKADNKARAIAFLDEVITCKRCNTPTIRAECGFPREVCMVCCIRNERAKIRRESRREAHDAGLKFCGECDEAKPLEAFVDTSPDKLRGRFARCRACAPSPSAWTAEGRYGLTSDTVTRLQSSPCELCRLPAKENRHGKSYIDHCHKSGRVRGPLCAACNHGLGQFRDSPDLLRAAAEYLESNTDYRNTK